MPYFQTKQGGDIAVNLALGTTGGAVVGIANYGISQITNTSAEVYVLAAPVAGVEKTLIFHQYSTTALPVVKLCTNAAQSVSILGVSTNLTVMKSAAGKSTVCPTVVQLKGISSTQWALTNIWPNMGSLTTGSTAVNNGIALSST